MDRSDQNPDALPDSHELVSRRVWFGARVLYVEEQGSGPAVLLIGAADEDAEFFRGIADRLSQVGSSPPGCSRLKRTSQPRLLLAFADVQPTAARKNLTRRSPLTRSPKAHFRHNPWVSERVIWAGLEHT
jgi:hypothetical protein